MAYTDFVQYVPVHPVVLNHLKEDFVGVHTITIDEISMVSDCMFSLISSRLSEITDCTLPFGGLNVIVVGDLFQVRPVKGGHVFRDQMLWHLFTPFFLRTNVRQCKDLRYGRLLNRARVDDLLPGDIDLLKTRLLSIDTGDIPDITCISYTRCSAEI